MSQALSPSERGIVFAVCGVSLSTYLVGVLMAAVFY